MVSTHFIYKRFIIGTGLLLAWMGLARAQGSAIPGKTAPPTPPVAPQGSLSAMSSIARAIATTLKGQATGPLVASAPLRSDTSAPRATELAARIAAIVAGSFGTNAKFSPVPLTLDAARIAALAQGTLLFLQPEVLGGRLQVSADVYDVPKNIWDRCLSTNAPPSAHAFVNAPIDAEVRAFLVPVPLVAAAPVKAASEDTEIVALVCDDLENDGAPEVLVVSRRFVTTARLRAGSLQALRRVPWDAFSPIAPAPLRQPIAFAALRSPGVVDIGITDRARAVRLDADLRVTGYLDGLPVPQPLGSGCGRLDVLVVADKLVPCSSSDPAPRISQPPTPFDAFASATIVDEVGKTTDVWATRNPIDGQALVQDSAGRSASIQDVGAQVAVADLDLDGLPEIVSSRNVLDEREDALIVRTWVRDGTMQQRLRVPVPSGLSAVAICPPEGPRMRAIALATKSELWIVR